eukprot:6571328-Prymnesium_polylepis.1
MPQGAAFVPVAGLRGGIDGLPSHLSLCVAPGLLLVLVLCFWCVSCRESTSGSSGGGATGLRSR